jgi:tRNA-2-methylthio-N6-dimethylallyladenosine synthase
VIAVAGCVAQQEGERLTRGMPQIDVVLGPDNIVELPGLLRAAEAGAPAQVRTVFDYDAPAFLQAEPSLVRSGSKQVTAFVTTMKGCDERCTFCIVPHTRGKERYRPSQQILDEVSRLVAAGTREITLLGQTVDSYRDPTGALAKAPLAGEGALRWGGRNVLPEDETEFPALLRAIAESTPGLQRLRYTSPHPRHLTPALVAAHRELPVLARHVHMPVQSGSDRVLKRMGRRYTLAEYQERTNLLREQVPGLTLSTDIIVGFPGETREQFEETLSLVSERGFIGVYAFKYSQRPFTPALNLPDDVSDAEKSSRLAELLDLSEVIRERHLLTLEGSTQDVLVEGRSKTGSLTGRTVRNEIVHFTGAEQLTGQCVRVRISRALRHSLLGDVLGEHSTVEPATLGAASAASLLAERQAAAAVASAAGKGPRSLPVLS